MITSEFQSQEHCPLCSSERNSFFFEDKFRNYLRCSVCSLIFVPPEFHVSAKSEKARYEEHNNDPDDPGYRQFLARIAVPIGERFAHGASGLDFGCGPTPLLADILRKDGYEMDVFDPFYADTGKVFEKEYDFVVTTEVVEHLKSPLQEFKKLLGLIKHNGMLAVMTRLYDETVDFKGWHYKNDRTHICFFSLETFEWLSRHLALTHERVDSDIFIFEQI